MTLTNTLKNLKQTIDHVIHPYGVHDPIPVPEAHDTDQGKLWDEWNNSIREQDDQITFIDDAINAAAKLEIMPEAKHYTKPKEPYVDPIKRKSPWDRFKPK
jgi:hypothetical protein